MMGLLIDLLLIIFVFIPTMGPLGGIAFYLVISTVLYFINKRTHEDW